MPRALVPDFFQNFIGPICQRDGAIALLRFRRSCTPKVLLPNGEILRTAQDAETVWSIYDSSIPAIVLSCVALMLAAAVLATLLTRALVQPVLSMTEEIGRAHV